jgi:hypothetical protein
MFAKTSVIFLTFCKLFLRKAKTNFRENTKTKIFVSMLMPTLPPKPPLPSPTPQIFFAWIISLVLVSDIGFTDIGLSSGDIGIIRYRTKIQSVRHIVFPYQTKLCRCRISAIIFSYVAPTYGGYNGGGWRRGWYPTPGGALQQDGHYGVGGSNLHDKAHVGTGICFYHYSYGCSSSRCKPPCLFQQGNG